MLSLTSCALSFSAPSTLPRGLAAAARARPVFANDALPHLLCPLLQRAVDAAARPGGCRPRTACLRQRCSPSPPVPSPSARRRRCRAAWRLPPAHGLSSPTMLSLTSCALSFSAPSTLPRGL